MMEVVPARVIKRRKPGGGMKRLDGLPNKGELKKMAQAKSTLSEEDRINAMLDIDDDEPKKPNPKVVLVDGVAYDATVMGAIVAERRDLGLKMDRAKLNTEEIKAEAQRFDYEVRRRQYVLRDAVRIASARHHSEMVQALRMIPDRIEHKFQLDPEVIELIGQEIDAALHAFSEAMKESVENV
jgi:hypothetical protein